MIGSRAKRTSSQDGRRRPATSAGPIPDDVHANGHDLSVAEHYRVARMCRSTVARTYLVRDVDKFIAQVKRAIFFWDGVRL